MFSLGVASGVGLAGVIARWRVRRLMQRRAQAERRARDAERMAEIGAMTGGLAHEIKNPLSTIGLNAQLLAEGVEELPEGAPVTRDDKQRLVRRIGSLRRETERLRGILQDFLTYAGEPRPDARRQDLNAALTELVDFFLPQAQTNGVRLHADFAPGEVPAVFDASLVKQAVLNLLLNAVQAMSTNAPGAPRELIVRTRAAQPRTPNEPRGAEIHVIDTGPGIPPGVRDRIFRPYFTTKSGGSGLGLPTARRLVEEHGGRLEVFTEPGRGTDFVVTLPRVA